MFLFILALSTILPAAGFVHAARTTGLARSIISHFWYFTLIWWMAFPFRAFLIEQDMTALQSGADVALIKGKLDLALLVALLFWVITYGGYWSVRAKNTQVSRAQRSEPSRGRGLAVIFVTLLLAGYFLVQTMQGAGGHLPFEAQSQNQARIGAGPFFLLAELFLWAAIAYLGRVLATGSKLMSLSEICMYVAVFLLAVFMSMALQSRRILAAMVFSLIVVYSLRENARPWLPALAILGSIVLAPVLQVFRHLEFFWQEGRAMNYLLNVKAMLFQLSSSYEGADHLAAFLAKAGWKGVLFGIDRGVAWVYNAGLSLVPRAIWAEKPLLYGNVAEQEYLYPWMFAKGPAGANMPVSFVVDFLYGFGISLGLLLTFFLGRFLCLLAQDLWDREMSSAHACAIALFVFVFMFNVVRGGTGFIQSLVLFLMIAGCVLGFRGTLGALMSLVRRLFWMDVTGRPEAVRASA